MGNAASKDIDKTLALSLEKLKKLGEDGSNEQSPNIERYVRDEISSMLDAEAPLREYFIKTFEALDAEAPLREYSIKTFEVQAREIELSGSVVEGAMTARIFQVDKDLELEVDLMYNVFTIQQELSHLLEPVKDKPGFVCLPFCLLPADRIDWYVNRCATKFLERHASEQHSLEQLLHYISPLAIRNNWKCINDQISSPSNTSDICNRMRDLLGLDSAFAPDVKINNSLTETTAAWEIVPQGMFRSLLGVGSYDWVPAVDLAFWPRQASDWIIRSRVCPPHDTIQSIVHEGCHVVPRTSPGGDVHSEWRLSFSHPEATLAKMRSREQQETYYFFKIFFYRYLKCIESSETEGKPLYSYIIKTTMLWACEELHPEDKIWASLENSIQMLLFKLLGSLELGLLSHYFIPEINLLERIGEDVRNQCIAVINRWISHVLMTAPFDLPEKRGIVTYQCIFSTMVGTFINDPRYRRPMSEMVEKLANKYAEEYSKKH